MIDDPNECVYGVAWSAGGDRLVTAAVCPLLEALLAGAAVGGDLHDIAFFDQHLGHFAAAAVPPHAVTTKLANPGKPTTIICFFMISIFA